MNLSQQLTNSIKTLTDLIDTLGSKLSSDHEQIIFLQEKITNSITDLTSSINTLIDNSVPYGWQIASIILSFVSVVIAFVSGRYMFIVKRDLRNSHNLDIIRRELIRIKNKLEKFSDSRPLASDTFSHTQKILSDIPNYMRGYKSHKQLNLKIDNITKQETMLIMDVRTDLEIIINELGAAYAQ